jgi:eukaryotic-like serine/threonine-protein kinase
MADKDLKRLESVFHAALGLPADARGVYLAQACAGDDSLYAEICSLVAASEARNDFMEQPALNLGLNVLSTATVKSMTGKTIGPYHVLSQLGKGGMGEVYLAEDTRLGRKVALKFLSQELVGDNWAKRQLIKEAQAVAMLDHPNICSVYDFEESGEHNFIVMQFIEGETLADLIHKQQINPDRVLELTRQIVAALAEAHAHGIIHRDVKPRNIMVTPDGQAKVLDFGLAKTIKQKDGYELAEKSTSHLTRNGIFAGTVSYMSPEQLRGERLDFRSDIFSLGTVLYELIQGQNPFLRASEAETISAILTSEPLPIKHSNGLERVVRQCLGKDRGKRYQSASELLIELSNSTIAPKKFNHLSTAWTIATAGLVLILVAAIVSFIFLKRQKAIPIADLPAGNQPVPTTYVYSLAVMPITSSNPARSGDYLTEGLTVSLVDKFSSLSQVRVSPYGAVSGYKGKTIDPKTVGTQLKVDALLLGHIVHRENKQILESRLIKVSDNSEIMRSEEEIKWKTILELPDELAKNVTRILELRFLDERKFLETHGTGSVEAFRQYMLGRYLWRMRDKANLRKAIVHFQKAIAMDATYARAHAGLADSYVLLNVVAFGETPTAEAMSRASSAAREALMLNEKLPEPHTSLGVIDLRFEWKWADAEQNFKQAMQLDDTYASAHYWYSQLLLVTGRWEEAVAESEKAKKLDPFSYPTVMNFCRTLSLSRQYEKAIACYDELLSENPTFGHAKYLRALVLQRSGRYDEALVELESLYSENQRLAGAALGYSYGRAGKIDQARKVLDEMKERSRHNYLPPFEFAIVYVGLGDKDKAFEALEAAYAERFATLIYIGVDPIFASLHDDPRYVALLQRLNLPAPRPF